MLKNDKGEILIDENGELIIPEHLQEWWEEMKVLEKYYADKVQESLDRLKELRPDKFNL